MKRKLKNSDSSLEPPKKKRKLQIISYFDLYKNFSFPFMSNLLFRDLLRSSQDIQFYTKINSIFEQERKVRKRRRRRMKGNNISIFINDKSQKKSFQKFVTTCYDITNMFENEQNNLFDSNQQKQQKKKFNRNQSHHKKITSKNRTSYKTGKKVKTIRRRRINNKIRIFKKGFDPIVEEEEEEEGGGEKRTDQIEVEKIKKRKKKKKKKKKTQHKLIKKNPEKDLRDIITSLDVEKNSQLLDNVDIKGTLTVGLILNLASFYNKNGKQLPKKKTVKCLTIIYLTNWSVEETERNFNMKSKTPCTSTRPYCGFFSVFFAIQNFKDLKQAKLAFFCWKQKTRGNFSRYQCGKVVYEEFKKKNSNLSKFVMQKSPQELLKKLRDFSNQDEKKNSIPRKGR